MEEPIKTGHEFITERLGLETPEEVGKEVQELNGKKDKNITNFKKFFHPVLNIDREEREVSIGIPDLVPGYTSKGKPVINESIIIINNKGEKWVLNQQEVEKRGLFPIVTPAFGLEGSHLKGFTDRIEAKLKHSEHGEPEKGVGYISVINPYSDVFLPIKEVFEHFIDFANPVHSTLLTLWTIGTYMYPIFEAYPYLYIGGQKQSGKSKVLDVLSAICHNPTKSSNTSASSMYRSISTNLSTVLIDESETLTGREANPDLRLILNAGYKQNNYVKRTNPDTLKQESFDVYSPKALASINLLDTTLSNRCISLIMLRTKNKEKGRTRINERSLKGGFYIVKLLLLTLQHTLYIADIFDKDEDLSNLNNRANELFLPLLAIASYMDKFNDSKIKLFPLINDFAKETDFDDDSLDDWSRWVLEALDTIVNDKIYYLIKDIKKEISKRRSEEEEKIDERLTNQWIGGCLRKFGLRKYKRGREGISYLIGREEVGELMSRYTVPSMLLSGTQGSQGTDVEAKTRCEPQKGVNPDIKIGEEVLF